MEMIDKRAHFKQRLDQLQEVIMGGLACYAVWNKLRLHDPADVPWSLERQNQVLGRWRGLFTPAGAALQQMALLEFAKVFDTDRRTASLVVLLEEARNDMSLVPHGTASDLDGVSARLKQAEHTLDTIKTLRNRRLAHSDARPQSLPPLMNSSIDNLAEDIKYAFNRLSSVHDRNVFSWDYAIRTSVEHTVDVLSILLKEIDRKREEFDDKMVDIALGETERIKLASGGPLQEDEVEYVVDQFNLTDEQEVRFRAVLKSDAGH